MRRYLPLALGLLICGTLLSGRAQATMIDFTGIAGGSDITVSSTDVTGNVLIEALTISDAPNASTDGSYLGLGQLNFN